MDVDGHLRAERLRLLPGQSGIFRLAAKHVLPAFLAGKRIQRIILHAQKQMREKIRLLGRKTRIRAANADQRIARLIIHTERILKLLLCLFLQCGFEVLHPGKIAEDRLGGAVERLRNRTRVHHFHSLAAKHFK